MSFNQVSLTRKAFIGAAAAVAAVPEALFGDEPQRKEHTTMLKGISPVISPDLLKILSEMGHGDELVISDAHFPAHTFGRIGGAPVLRADGIPADRLLAGLQPLFELDAYATPVVMMAPVPGDKLDPAVERDYRAALKYEGKIELMERFAFYERAKKAYAIVLSGETRIYGNIIVKKGVTPVA